MGCACTAHPSPQESHKSRGDASSNVTGHLPDSGLSFHQEYRILQKLGQGSYAHVYLVSKINADAAGGHEQDSQFAAKIVDLRELSIGTAGRSDRTRRKAQNVVNEVNVLRAVGSHGQCIGIIGYFEDQSFAYIVLPKCEYNLLDALERSIKLTEHLYKSTFQDMLKALVHIHSLDIVHLDIKPENFLCNGKQLAVKLSDFGLAMALPQGQARLRGARGTVPYMSPEMLQGSTYGVETDMWSLGVTAHVLLTGTFPYQPSSLTRDAMKAAIVRKTPESVVLKSPPCKPTSRSTPWLSRYAVQFIQSLLSRQPRKRPSASKASRGTWFRSEEEPSLDKPDQLGDFHRVLLMAKRLSNWESSTKGESDDSVDRMLAQLQAKYHNI